MSAQEPSANASPMSTNEELANYIDGLIDKLQSKFDSVNTQINEKLEEMNVRIDRLDRSLNDLMTHVSQGENKSEDSA
ncbi:hypothetical protein BX666DRAFT_1895541 [Dichotomocladium elegans]|nr:hypothetical protein BX666DRAFT_1895541 [Dichotomocladium elegans]